MLRLRSLSPLLALCAALAVTAPMGAEEQVTPFAQSLAEAAAEGLQRGGVGAQVGGERGEGDHRHRVEDEADGGAEEETTGDGNGWRQAEPTCSR